MTGSRDSDAASAADTERGGTPRTPTDEAAAGVSRRGFLGLLALSGAAALAGCAGENGDTTTSAGPTPQPTANLPDPVLQDRMGPEPASYVPPAPTPRPNRASQPETVQCNVCVVGGGAAGAAAATCAARTGATVTLLEESYLLGGNITRGLVNLDKVSWGGEIMVAGYFRELIINLEQSGHAVYPRADTHYAVPFAPDALRHEMLLLARRAGADVRLGSRAVWVERDGRRIASVLAEEQGRDVQVEADVFVDCTGDGNLGFLAGAGYWLGDRKLGEIQGQTLIFLAGPVDFEQLSQHASQNGGLVSEYQVIGLRDFMTTLTSQGQVEGTPQRGLLINRNMDPSYVSVSGSEVYSNHLEPGNLSKILTMLQKQNYQIHDGLRAEVPGFALSRIVRMAERPYLREGRRLIGYAQLTLEDVLEARKPPDSIARGWYPVDLHVSYGGGATHLGALRAGDWYGIPYACLVARDADNLLMAGRCISVTHEALGSTRVSPLSMALGQAAGIAATLSAQAGQRPADLAAEAVQRGLRDQGGLL